jgi:hypothetical protein
MPLFLKRRRIIRPTISSAPAAPFTPADLFSGGEKGFWYDATDVANLHQTTDTSTPVSANNDPIGRIADLSGNGNHLVQATGAARPAWNSGGFIDGEGTSSWMQVAAVVLTTGPVMTVIGKISSNDGGSAAYVHLGDGSININTSPTLYIGQSFSGGNPNIFNLLQGDVGGTARSGAGTPTGLDNTPFTYRAVTNFSLSAAEATMHIDGAVHGSQGADSDNTNANWGTLKLTIFSRNDGVTSIHPNWRMYGLIGVNRLLTAGELTDVEAYLSGL